MHRHGTRNNRKPAIGKVVRNRLLTSLELRSAAAEMGPSHVPTVPISVKAPVTASILYIEMLFEPELVT